MRSLGEDTISLESGYPSLEEILPQALQQLKIPRQITGATERGWSRMKLLQTCPYLYAATYKGLLGEDGGKRERKPAAEVGTLFHAMTALYYNPKKPLDRKLADRLFDIVCFKGADPEVTEESQRLFNAYVERYREDYLRPLAAEWDGVDQQGNTCRFDLVAEVADDQPECPAGVYAIEHKTRSRFDASALNWENDGEILGQINAGMSESFESKFGVPLSGVIVNIIGRQKEIRFLRLVIPVQEDHRQHVSDLKVWRAVEAMYESTGVWPRARAACVGPYGPCQLYRHCAGEK